MGYSIFDETMVDMSWPQIEKAAQEDTVILFPTGVIEEHGPHMGLAVDIYCSHLTCKRTKRALEDKGVKSLIAPPYYWGINQATGAFPGSFSVRSGTMKALLYDILDSLKRWGFQYVFIMNWHGDNDHNLAILEAVRKARQDLGVNACFLVKAFDVKRLGLKGNESYVIVQGDSRLKGPPPKYLEIHAESLETGIMSRYIPEHVDVEMAKTLQSTDLTLEDLMIWRKGWSDARKVTPLGYFGDPARFDKRSAEETVENNAREIARLIESYLNGTYKPPA